MVVWYIEWDHGSSFQETFFLAGIQSVFKIETYIWEDM